MSSGSPLHQDHVCRRRRTARTRGYRRSRRPS
jgi:hypothetical protein